MLVNYGYDETGIDSYNVGHLTTITRTETGKPQSIIAYHYDAMGRNTIVIRTIDGVSYTTNVGYDLAGRMNYIKYPDTNQTEYQYLYDSLGNLEQVNEVDGVNLIDILADFEGYNALGQIGYASYANGTGTDYTYYQDNYRLQELTTTNASGIIQKLDYHFDDAGNVDTLTSSTKPLATGPAYTVNYNFGYDNLDRLTSATAASSDSTRAYNQTYQYDEVGNMTRKTGIGGWEVLSWDNSYQPKKPASVRFDFESEGIGRRNLTYNHTNMPVQISYKGGTPSYLTYDGEGNRIKKVQGASTTIYVGDIFEKRGAIEVSHIYANGKRIMSRTSDGKEYYTHTDHLGSTNLVTDETGQVIEENGYLPFGGALFRNEYNGGTFKSAYRYTGQELDSEYELYNYNARLYDPVMSRFISPDTIIPDPYNPQSLNRYAYCLNNPLKYTDPSGHMDEYTLPEIVVNGYRPMSIEDILTWINMTCVPPEPPSAFSPLSRDEIRNNEEFRILVATVYGEAGKSSKTAWKAITCVALNRVGKREWSKYHTVKDIIAKTGFDAYGRKTSEYKLAIEYLAADKLGTNQRIDNIAKEIYPIYIGFYKDITENAVLYYSPKAQLELSVKYPDTYSATPKWDFEVISEVTISGMQSTDDFKFYKYK